MVTDVTDADTGEMAHIPHAEQNLTRFISSL